MYREWRFVNTIFQNESGKVEIVTDCDVFLDELVLEQQD